MNTTQSLVGPDAPLSVLPTKCSEETITGELRNTDSLEMQEWIRRRTEQIVAAARRRWPRFGPWRLVITCGEDGRCEWMLRGRSWKSPDVADRARMGATLEDLERRVLIDMDE